MAQMPQRVRVNYCYAIGIALRNHRRPIGVGEICNFVKVHMRKICTWKNDSWETCLKSIIMLGGFFAEITKREENSDRDDYIYMFAPGKEAEWEEKYPIDKYDPQTYLEVPISHHILYYGKIGPPTEQEIAEAKRLYNEERAPWRKEKPKKLTKAQTRQRKEKERKRLEMQLQAEMEKQHQEETNNAVRGLENFGDEEQEENDFAPEFDQNQNPQLHQEEREELEDIPEEENDDPMPQLEPEVFSSPNVQSHRRFAAALQNQQQQHQQRKHSQQGQVTPRIPKPHEPRRASPYDLANRPGTSKQEFNQAVHGVQRTAAPLPLQNLHQQRQKRVFDDIYESDYDDFERQGTSKQAVNQPIHSVRPPSTPSPLQLRQQQRQEYSNYKVSHSDNPEEVIMKKKFRIQNVEMKQIPQQNSYKPQGISTPDIPPHRLLSQRKRTLPLEPQQAPLDNLENKVGQPESHNKENDQFNLLLPEPEEYAKYLM